MTIEKIGKALSAFPLIFIGLILVAGVITIYLFLYYEKTDFYTIDDSVPIGQVEMRIDSITISNKTAGYRTEIPGADVKVGNQTAHSEPDFNFVILKLTIINKNDKIVSTSNVQRLVLETSFKQIYKGNSIFDIFQKFSRTVATEEELRNFYCESFPQELPSRSSATTCLIFHIQDFERPSKLFYTEDGKILFVINLH